MIKPWQISPSPCYRGSIKFLHCMIHTRKNIIHREGGICSSLSSTRFHFHLNFKDGHRKRGCHPVIVSGRHDSKSPSTSTIIKGKRRQTRSIVDTLSLSDATARWSEFGNEGNPPLPKENERSLRDEYRCRPGNNTSAQKSHSLILIVMKWKPDIR